MRKHNLRREEWLQATKTRYDGGVSAVYAVDKHLQVTTLLTCSACRCLTALISKGSFLLPSLLSRDVTYGGTRLLLKTCPSRIDEGSGVAGEPFNFRVVAAVEAAEYRLNSKRQGG